MDWKDIVRRRMSAKGLTQSDVAKELGIGRAAFGHWLSDRRQPSFRQMLHLAEIIGVPISELSPNRLAEMMLNPAPNAELPPIKPKSKVGHKPHEVGDIGKPQLELLNAVRTLSGRLTDDQARLLMTVLHAFVGQNIAENANH